MIFLLQDRASGFYFPAENIPTTSSWFISGGREFVVLTSLWENASDDVAVQVGPATPEATRLASPGVKPDVVSR